MEKQPNATRSWDSVDAVKAGRILRRARQFAKKDMEDIAAEMRVKLYIIEDLENGDWSRMPGDTYAKGYMRRYAEIVDIEPPEASEPTRTNEQVTVSKVKRLAMGLRGTSLVMRRSLVLAGILLSVALVTWSVLDETKQRVSLEIVKSVPDTLEQAVNKPIIIPTARTYSTPVDMVGPVDMIGPRAIAGKTPTLEKLQSPIKKVASPKPKALKAIKKVSALKVTKPKVKTVTTAAAEPPVEAVTHKPRPKNYLPRINIKPKKVEMRTQDTLPESYKPSPSALDDLFREIQN